MDKCPYCSAETRPGDNFCLNCGNRLPTGTPAAQPVASEVTVPTDDNWVAPTARSDAPTVQSSSQAASAIAQPARVILRTENGEARQEFVLEKLEIAIGRAPNSDILLSKDKLTSRRHATITYENGVYYLTDERSANGTFVNGQQLEEKTPYKLKNGDIVGIGEYELVFQDAAASDVAEMGTQVFSSDPSTKYETEVDSAQTSSAGDPFGTRPWEDEQHNNGASIPEEAAPVSASAPSFQEVVAEAEAVAQAATEDAPVATSTPVPVVNTPPPGVPSRPLAPVVEGNVTFNRLTSLPQPQLPDVAPLMAALATLDGQVSSLQEQLNETQEAMRNHEADIAQTTSQLRTGVRRVSERMDTAIADVARSREQLAWAELLQLMEDVMNNPRDIEYVTKLARKARELNKVFQIHQNVLNTLAECTSLLRSLIGE